MTLYIFFVIKGFRHKGLERFFLTGSKAGIQPRHAARLRVQLTALEHAISHKDMNAPGWRLHRLGGNLAGFYAVSVSGNWRLIFRFEGTDVVEVDYIDLTYLRISERRRDQAKTGEKAEFTRE